MLQSILKSSGASTLDIVARVKAALPRRHRHLAAGRSSSTLLFDQSLYVRAAIGASLKEAGIAAGLTALMILLFLGSWRSTLIVITSIPLSILVSLIILGCLGQTLNLMTLGGLSLAVGILVDDATVELENVHRNLGMRKPIVTRHPRRRAADRRARAGGDALHLHRLHPGRLHLRRGQARSSRRSAWPSSSP